MNKTLSIGLAGFSFIIEEHAYIKLSDYLSALRGSLDASEADEVMYDIENRMVEIFRSNLQKREVINDDDVEKVIAQIGRPEIIEEQEEAYYSNKSKTQTGRFTRNENKKLFRDPEKQKVAGVCAGLAQYFGMDITLMRTIWVVVFLIMIPAYGSAFLVPVLYAILWAILPKAQTASEFLQMRGEPINFDTLKSESGKIVQFANESSQRIGEIYNENRPYIRSASSGFANAIRYIFGGFFALLSFLCLAGAFAIMAYLANGIEGAWKNEMSFLLEDGSMNYLLSAILVIGSLIPALIFGIISLKLFSPNYKVRNIGYVLGALFLILVALSLVFGLHIAKQSENYKGHKEDTEEVAINTTSDTLYVDLKKVTIPTNFTAYDNDLFSDKKTVFAGDYPYGDITRKPGITSPYLIIKKSAEGYNMPLNLNVPVQISGNRLLLPNFISYPYVHRFRDYDVEYELVVPQNMTVIISNEDKIGLDEDNDDDTQGTNYNNQNNNSAQVKINGNTIISTNDNDSVIINNKKYSQGEADRVMDSIKNSIKKSGKADLQVKDKGHGVTIKVE